MIASCTSTASSPWWCFSVVPRCAFKGACFQQNATLQSVKCVKCNEIHAAKRVQAQTSRITQHLSHWRVFASLDVNCISAQMIVVCRATKSLHFVLGTRRVCRSLDVHSIYGNLGPGFRPMTLAEDVLICCSHCFKGEFHTAFRVGAFEAALVPDACSSS